MDEYSSGIHEGINIRSQSDFLREQVDAVKSAALLGYGALLAHNTDGKYDLVLAAMRAPLFPTTTDK